ncbi:MAG: chemotaxis protein CheW [Syntrophobacteraceae bacterium]
MASEEFLQEYVVEVKEHLHELESSLLVLEREGRVSEEINQMFRAAHSIKGASAYMGFEGLANLTHELETLISQLQNDSRSVSSKGINVLLQCIDHISGALEHLQRGGEEPPLPASLIDDLHTALGHESAGVDSGEKAFAGHGSPELQDSDFDFDIPSFPEMTELTAQPAAEVEEASVCVPQAQPAGGEEEDQELLTIFMESFQKFFGEFAAILTSSSEKTLPDADFERIHDLVKRLVSSSQYMDYQEVVSRLSEWENAIKHHFRSGATDRQTMLGLLGEYGHLLKEVLPTLDLNAVSRERTDLTLTQYGSLDEEDEELLTIYMDSFQQQFDILVELAHGMAGGALTARDLPGALDTVRRLISSSRYMDYEQVATILEEWESTLAEAPADGAEATRVFAASFDVYAERLKRQLPGLKTPPAVAVGAPPVKSEEPGLPNIEAEIDRSFDMLEQSMGEFDFAWPGEGSEPEVPHSDLAAPEPVAERSIPSEKACEPIQVAAQEAPTPTKERVSTERTSTPSEESHASATTLRVDAQKVDQLLNQVGELVVARSEFIQTSLSFRDLMRELTSQGKLSKQEQRKLKALGFTLNENTLSLGRIANNLQGSVMRVRMLPVSQMFQRFPRIVRDQALRLDKKVDLIIEGGETEIDKTVLEQMNDPLVQFLRNAIAHGIESPEDRRKVGKPETGTIRLAAYHEGDYVTLEVEDDGRGVDLKKLRKVLEGRNELTAHELSRLTDSELSYAIFLPGVSTHDRVDGHAGRGVGLDVVKENVERMNGTIEVETQPGRGTRFIIRIPLTLAIIRALLVKGANQVFTIPLSSVAEIMRYEHEKTHTIEGFEVISLHGKTIPLVHLGSLLNLHSSAEEKGHRFIVIVATSFREVGVVVDGLMGEREVVIKSLEDGVHVFKGFSGATILGDGTVSLILDVSTLIRVMNEAMSSPKPHGQSVH